MTAEALDPDPMTSPAAFRATMLPPSMATVAVAFVGEELFEASLHATGAVAFTVSLGATSAAAAAWPSARSAPTHTINKSFGVIHTTSGFH